MVPIPAGEVTFHDKIGSHDISVTHVLDRDRFVDWVEKYLRKAGVDNPSIPEPMKAVVAEYLQGKFQWFVFDVVELATELKTKEAIEYRFRTTALIIRSASRGTEEGDTGIRLLILSPELIPLPSRRAVRIRLAHDPVRLSPGELQSLGSDGLTVLLKGRNCMLQIWEITGAISGFKKDLVASVAW